MTAKNGQRQMQQQQQQQQQRQMQRRKREADSRGDDRKKCKCWKVSRWRGQGVDRIDALVGLDR
jgi:hypothetical protein